MYYISNYTNFCASEPPYTDTIYYKNGNETLAKIHVNKDWSMTGSAINPFELPIGLCTAEFGYLNQEQCERLIMQDMPKPNRKDIMKKYNMKVLDYAMIMYKTRLINMINSYWVAWSEDDKVEDYHPRYNEKLRGELDSYLIQLDPESEDNEQLVPYIKLDEQDDNLHSTPEDLRIDMSELIFSDEPFVGIYDKKDIE